MPLSPVSPFKPQGTVFSPVDRLQARVPDSLMVEALLLTAKSLLCEGNYRKIGRRAKLTTQHVSRTLRGVRGVSFHVAKRIATAAGVTLDELYDYISAQEGYRSHGRRTLADPKPRPPRLDINGLTKDDHEAAQVMSLRSRLEYYRNEIRKRAAGTPIDPEHDATLAKR